MSTTPPAARPSVESVMALASEFCAASAGFTHESQTLGTVIDAEDRLRREVTLLAGGGEAVAGFKLRSFRLESGKLAQCVLYDSNTKGAGVSQEIPEGEYDIYLAAPLRPSEIATAVPVTVRMLTAVEIDDCDCGTIQATARHIQSKFCEVNNLKLGEVPVTVSGWQPPDSSWTVHTGGKRPTYGGCIDLLFRDGDEVLRTRASEWFWTHAQEDGDIVAWRVAAGGEMVK